MGITTNQLRISARALPSAFCGGFEERGAVGLYGNSPENPLNVPRAFVADVRVPADVAVAIKIFENAQSLDRAARDALESVALVDVVEEYVAVVQVGVGFVDDFVGQLARLDRHGFVDISARLNRVQEGYVVEFVDKANALRLVSEFENGGNNVVLGKRIGVYDSREFVVNEPVLDFGLERLAERRVFVDLPLLFDGALGDVEKVELADARDAVVPRDNADEFIGVVRDLAAIEKRVRPVARRAVEGRLRRSVGIHMHQNAREIVRVVGVLPAGVEHAPVFEHRGRPVGVLLESQLAD